MLLRALLDLLDLLLHLALVLLVVAMMQVFLTVLVVILWVSSLVDHVAFSASVLFSARSLVNVSLLVDSTSHDLLRVIAHHVAIVLFIIV